MLVEIPDLDIILSVIVAFLAGILGLVAYHKILPKVRNGQKGDATQSERLEYYERQLIDMKIRLDAIELEEEKPDNEERNFELKQILENLVRTEIKEKPNEPKNPEIVADSEKNSSPTPKLDNNNPIEYVLHLVTNKPMTSRDIQITLKRSREHTSRLMKKLFEEGYVKRNTDSKPYTYSISDKGKQKINLLESNPTII